MTTVRLTMAQALTRYMAAQQIRQFDGSAAPAFAGVWAILVMAMLLVWARRFMLKKTGCRLSAAIMNRAWRMPPLRMQNKRTAAN